MMTLTTEGLLRTEETVEEIANLHGGEQAMVRGWFCPFGSHNPEWRKNKRMFKQTYVEVLTLDEIEWLGEECRLGVMDPELERRIFANMSHRFSGPITGCPGPQTPDEVIAVHWSDWIMHQFCKHGDMPLEGDPWDVDPPTPENTITGRLRTSSGIPDK